MRPTNRLPSGSSCRSRPALRAATAACAAAATVVTASCGRDQPQAPAAGASSATASAPVGPRLHVAPPPGASTGGAPTSPAAPPVPDLAAAESVAVARRRGRAPDGRPLCDEGLRPSGEPRRDVVRLGLSCGSSEGLERDLDAIEGAIAAGGATVEVPVPLAAGRCYRIVAAAEPTVADLDVELRSERDVPLATDDDDAPLVVVHRGGAVCASAAATARAVFRAGSGRGRFAAEVWSRPARAGDRRAEEPRATGSAGEGTSD